MGRVVSKNFAAITVLVLSETMWEPHEGLGEEHVCFLQQVMLEEPASKLDTFGSIVR